MEGARENLYIVGQDGEQKLRNCSYTRCMHSEYERTGKKVAGRTFV